MGDRVERLLEVHKAHIEWWLVLACLVHQYSEIRDLISCPPALSESCLFICNFRFGLYSVPLQYDPKKDLACVGDKSNCSVICTLLIAFLGKWDERGERPFLWPLKNLNTDEHISANNSKFCIPLWPSLLALLWPGLDPVKCNPQL